jgi:uncharacterized protein YndB with AHSA1/START domain
MKDQMTHEPYGELVAPNTVRLQRQLPGPVERVWAYLAESDLRARWLAAGEMTLEVGAPFSLTWRNGELTTPPGARPEGMTGEHFMESRITELDPPRRLSFEWEGSGGVSFELEPQGSEVLLTVTHHGIERRSMLLGVSSGWHAHLDLLVARISEYEPLPFWDVFSRVRAEYEGRIPQ